LEAQIGALILSVAGILAGATTWLIGEKAHRRTKVWVFIVIFAVTTVAGFISLGEISSSSPTSADQVRACMTQHRMDRAQISTKTLAESRAEPGAENDAVTIHKRCDWPPPAWADSDGYSEIRVQTTVGPGDTEATGTSVADIIQAPCPSLKVTYSIAAQGFQEPLATFTSRPNTVVRDSGEAYPIPPNDPLPFYYEADELVVLRSAKGRLDVVECVK
jgi:hypothetical protein